MEIDKEQYGKGLRKLAALEAEGVEITKQMEEAFLSSVHVERTRLWRLRHPDRVARNKEIASVAGRELKIEVLTHYGRGEFTCVVCGENRFACLTLDHIKGRDKGDKKHGNALYRRLRKDNYPEGFRTLCMNCQWVKRYENGEFR